MQQLKLEKQINQAIEKEAYDFDDKLTKDFEQFINPFILKLQVL